MPTLPQLRRPHPALRTASSLSSSAVAAATDHGRYEFVDALRGIAAILVAVQHSAEILALPGLRVSGHPVPINLGETGVVLFFLVSGLVIPPSIERHGSLARFWLKRLCRLFPAYWASLAGCLLLVAAGLFPPPFVVMRHPAFGAVLNLTMLQSFVGVPSAIGAYWTLPLELIFYAFCSAAFLLRVLRRPVLCLALGLAALFAAEIIAAGLHRSVPAGRFGLLLSAIFGAVVQQWLTREVSRRALGLSALALGSVVGLGLWLRFSRFPVSHEVAAPTASAVLLSWLLAAVLFWTLVSMREQRMPSPLLALGRISYSVYLWHIPVIVLVGAEASRHGLDHLPAWVLLPTVLGATWVVSEISYRLVERPGMRLGASLSP